MRSSLPIVDSLMAVVSSAFVQDEYKPKVGELVADLVISEFKSQERRYTRIGVRDCSCPLLIRLDASVQSSTRPETYREARA